MTQQSLERGHTANLGAGVVAGNLTLNGVAANYTISINGAAAVAHVAAVGVPVIYPILGQSVSVVNTSLPPGPANLIISW